VCTDHLSLVGWDDGHLDLISLNESLVEELELTLLDLWHVLRGEFLGQKVIDVEILEELMGQDLLDTVETESLLLLLGQELVD